MTGKRTLGAAALSVLVLSLAPGILPACHDVTLQENELGDRLIQAVSNNQTKIAIALINGGADVNAEREGLTPLTAAAERNNVVVVEALVDAGAAVDTKGILGKAALHHAAIIGNPDIANILIRAGADVNIKDDMGNTPLFYAACGGFTVVLDVLAKAGADIEAKNEDGRTALTCCQLKDEAALLLLEAGADPNAVDAYGSPVLSYYVRGEPCARRAEDLTYFRVIKHLCRHGVRADNEWGEKGLLLAICRTEKKEWDLTLEVAEALLNADANPDSIYGGRNTALMLAVSVVRIEMIRLLIRHEADVNYKLHVVSGTDGTDGYDLTALLVAMKIDNTQITKILLDAGAVR